jgi:hypothetical protein
MEEIWKDIPEYEGLYQVSSFGNVRSFNGRWSKELTILKQKTNNKTGYRFLTLCKNKKQKTITIHQLVAMGFLGHKPDRYNVVINHIDNNRLNNNVSNLELVSNRYNTSCHKTDVGSFWDKHNKKWKSAIKINGVDVHLGSFDDKDRALQIYQRAINNIHLYDGDNKKFRALLNQ